MNLDRIPRIDLDIVETIISTELAQNQKILDGDYTKSRRSQACGAIITLNLVSARLNKYKNGGK